MSSLSVHYVLYCPSLRLQHKRFIGYNITGSSHMFNVWKQCVEQSIPLRSCEWLNQHSDNIKYLFTFHWATGGLIRCPTSVRPNGSGGFNFLSYNTEGTPNGDRFCTGDTLCAGPRYRMNRLASFIS